MWGAGFRMAPGARGGTEKMEEHEQAVWKANNAKRTSDNSPKRESQPRSWIGRVLRLRESAGKL